ncbi:SOS response-associated peptidase [Rubrimonas cliftonensis]|uniref:Abasic site processing protein n=1 Tax=Rubrimonas cliftonensis TaxID=89524 RepID=A0A1H4BWL3_9RHOB|nr:SOS response-associated peptidase family protein [Rubrimonas cliftonensis]SEA52484.1 Putative SOS response-associated peptidase YedK [Rubrimonas cliftonensis]
MCNLYANTMPQDAMRRLFDVSPEDDALGNFAPAEAIFPRHDAVIVRRGEDGARRLGLAHWGFVLPQVSKRTGAPILPKAVNNARDDTMRASRFWRESFETRRCLMPATSYCEAKGTKPATYVWFAMVGEAARPPFAFAGIWKRHRGRYRDDLVDIETCAMLTTAPNALARTVHPDRMPVILAPDDWETWLAGDADAAAALLAPFPAEAMRIAREGLDAKSDPTEG